LLVDGLLKNGTDVNAIKDIMGMSPLMVAVEKGSIEIIDILLNNGSDINIKGADGTTPLMIAAENGRRDVVEILINKGADINLRNANGVTSLMAAAKSGDINIVKTIIEKGMDVNIQDKEGMTALMNAVRYGHAGAVQVLLAIGADLNMKNKDGQSALALIGIVKTNRNIILRALLDPGADVNEKDADNGATALIYASREGQEDVVKALLKKGADATIKDNDDQTALYYAEKEGYSNIVKCLIEKYPAPAKATSLLFIQKEKDGYHIKRMQLDNKIVKDLSIQKDWPCNLDVDEKAGTIFIITETSVQEIVFTPEVKVKEPVKFPFKIPVTETDGERNLNYRGQTGYLKNGNLATINVVYGKDYKSDVSLYEFDKDKWTLLKQAHCRLDEDCGVDDLNSHNWRDWRGGNEVWHSMLLLNPFIVDRNKLADAPADLPVKKEHGDLNCIRLSINGHESVLYYFTETGDMTPGPYTFSMYLKSYKDTKPVDISDDQCDTSVEDKYLLLNKYWGKGLELIDLETGEKIFKDLIFAFWIY